MMLVDTDAVETQLLGIGQGVDVLAIKIVALDRIVEAIGKPDPGGIVFVVEVGRQIRPGHQVKKIDLHSASSHVAASFQLAGTEGQVENLPPQPRNYSGLFISKRSVVRQ